LVDPFHVVFAQLSESGACCQRGAGDQKSDGCDDLVGCFRLVADRNVARYRAVKDVTLLS
jgi:hypothetical protein